MNSLLHGLNGAMRAGSVIVTGAVRPGPLTTTLVGYPGEGSVWAGAVQPSAVR